MCLWAGRHRWKQQDRVCSVSEDKDREALRELDTVSGAMSSPLLDTFILEDSEHLLRGLVSGTRLDIECSVGRKKKCLFCSKI